MLIERFRTLLSELTKFGVVGFVSLVVDVVVFNAVLLAMPHKPLTAKVIATLVSATNAYVLNRHWSFRARTRARVRRELPLFMLFNGVGLGLALACLALSHYVLGFESRLADNIAANVVGLALGTTFRFWSYRRFVWTAPVLTDVSAAGTAGAGAGPGRLAAVPLPVDSDPAYDRAG